MLCWDMRELCEEDSDDYRYASAVLNALHSTGMRVFDHKTKEEKDDTGNRQ